MINRQSTHSRPIWEMIVNAIFKNPTWLHLVQFLKLLVQLLKLLVQLFPQSDLNVCDYLHLPSQVNTIDRYQSH